MGADLRLIGRVTGRRGADATTWYLVVWTVFLIVPILLIVLLSDAGPWWNAAGIIATVAFGVEWVRTFRSFDSAFDPGRWAPAVGSWRAIVFGMLRLAAIAAVTVPAIGSSANAFGPYFASMLLFTLPLRTGLIAVHVLVVAMGAWTVLETGDLFGASFTGPLVGVGFISFGRIVAGMGEREDRTRHELAAVHERESISRDIHDILGHTLTVVSLKSQLARRTLRADPERAEAELDEVLRLTQTALDDVRATVGRLRTPELAAQVEAARLALADAGVELRVRGGWEPLDSARRAIAAWAVREATTNIIRHAGAAECRMSFAPDRVEIVDDGDGTADALEGHGLTGLRRRVADAGGELVIAPAHPGRERPGTRVEVRFA